MTRRLSLWVLVCVAVASFFVVRFFEPSIALSRTCDLEVKVREIRRQGFVSQIRTKEMIIKYYGEIGDLRAGDLIYVKGKCVDVRNASEKHYSEKAARYWTGQGIYLQMYAKELKIIRKNYDLYTLRHDLIHFTEGKLDAMFGKDAPMIKALVYGDRSEMSGELMEVFSKSGTAHILALSGFHVGILAVAIHVLLAKRAVQNRGLIICIVLMFYAFLTGLRPSILRAVIFFGLYFFSFLRYEKFDLFSVSCMTASILLVLEPRYLYDRGFVLSFAGVHSIALFYILLRQAVQKFRFASHPITQAILVTISAQVLTLPLGWYYFGRVSIVSLLSNLVVMPLISILMILAILSLFVHLLSLMIPFFYAMDLGLVASVRFLQSLVLRSNGFFSDLPHAYFDLEPLSAIELLMIYFVIFALYLMWELHTIKENRYEPQGIKKIIIE